MDGGGLCESLMLGIVLFRFSRVLLLIFLIFIEHFSALFSRLVIIVATSRTEGDPTYTAWQLISPSASTTWREQKRQLAQPAPIKANSMSARHQDSSAAALQTRASQRTAPVKTMTSHP
jgi:hypothetical protein